MRLTLNVINAALAAKGREERLARGKGYFYFYNGFASDWPESGVYVYRLNELTLEQWLYEHERLSLHRKA